MSYSVIVLVAKARLPGVNASARQALALMADFARDDGTEIRCSISKLADDNGLHEKNLRRSIRELRDGGWLIDTGRRHRRGTVVYSIPLDRLTPLKAEGVEKAATPLESDTPQPRYPSNPTPLNPEGSTPLESEGSTPLKVETRSSQRIQSEDPVHDHVAGEAAPEGQVEHQLAEQIADELIAFEGELLAPHGVRLTPQSSTATRRKLVALFASPSKLASRRATLKAEGLDVGPGARGIADAFRAALEVVCASEHHRGQRASSRGKRYLLRWLLDTPQQHAKKAADRLDGVPAEPRASRGPAGRSPAAPSHPAASIAQVWGQDRSRSYWPTASEREAMERESAS